MCTAINLNTKSSVFLSQKTNIFFIFARYFNSLAKSMTKSCSFYFCIIFAFTLISLSGCGLSAEEKQAKIKADSLQNVRNILLSYWANPTFINEDFGEQITATSAELEMYDLREDRVYFSLRKDLLDSTTLSKLTEMPDSVIFGKEEGNKVALGHYKLRKPGYHFFSIPSKTFKVPEKINLIIPFAHYTYTITGQELIDYVKDRSIMGGKLSFIETERTVNQWISSNHGAMVAVKNEPSLMRLVEKITAGITNEEKKVQALLNFVTEEIPYNEKERNAKREILKRPNEVLMTRTSDCSGKTILYASLLEQIGADYRLAYLHNHICVLVKGSFKKDNRLNISLNDTDYFLAETTLKDFVIGETLLENPPKLERDVAFIQKPEKDGQILRYPSGEPVKFR